ncbi:helix-turn-helix domain-containing protein [Yersinia massiliensis]|jgi:HTH-type transcriptional regulator/antitoxin HipB|uniref:Helix-turn-helix domain-containing protein n=1 Tax=Yersinia massiliensis TaxID=419257 RepID=A0A2R4NU48_9GAMM|nr:MULTISPECIES: helix-turn-helix domain-containing protein [Yersinia]HEC1650263.1 helix-turn-helix domain-containing protein [Yersinia enterocolitica]ATM88557.1 transcriptional regulator [Yersinia frederiksenii]AVX39637.1 helix-turn-helix domain-containing protein [Yersinia massiliensis]MCB5316769.1 helix-turn-helix domain-containing protein [Yersinia massiliensis]MDA5548265.1 helix-turn-helix domain-containing protein [Yersinia massiliensis]
MKITSAAMLANTLRNERKKSKLTQRKTAETVGLKQSTVSEFENHPDGTKLDTLFKLLAALDLELQVRPRNRNIKDNTTWDQEW